LLLFKKNEKKINYVLVDLMKAFMVLQEQPFITQPIQEIPIFKSQFQGYLKDEPIVLVGHTNMHLFQFFVDFSKWLVMQYKVFPTNSIWSPKDGLQFDYGSLMIKVTPSFLVEFPNIFLSILFGGMMPQS